MRIVFVAEQFAPPVFDGSTTVYDTWLRMLARRSDEVFALLFSRNGEPTAETHAELRRLCRDYRILPGTAQQSRLHKAARAAGRFFTKGLFAPGWVEEAGRDPIRREIAEFLDRHRPDVLVMSKLDTVNLLGERNLRRFPGLRILDLHDDFVVREGLERRVLATLTAEHPALANYPLYRMARMRHWLSRYDPVRARRQERRLIGMFDRVLISSMHEHRTYAAELGLGGVCVHAPWPIGGGPSADMAAAPAPEFDAGFIASAGLFNLEALLFLVNDVLPLVRRRRPGFRLLVAGGVAVPYAMLGPTAEGVVLEPSFADVAAVYARIGVALVPLLSGTGVSVKTLEALRFGRPVVATPSGARGLDAEATPGLHLAEGAAAFAARVCDLLDGAAASAPRCVPEAGSDGPARRPDAVAEFYDLFRRVCADAARDGRPAPRGDGAGPPHPGAGRSAAARHLGGAA